jgi:hypothetical protein
MPAFGDALSQAQISEFIALITRLLQGTPAGPPATSTCRGRLFTEKGVSRRRIHHPAGLVAREGHAGGSVACRDLRATHRQTRAARDRAAIRIGVERYARDRASATSNSA